MPTKIEIIEDLLGAVEEKFYETLKDESYPNYFGGRVEITYSTKPRLEIDIREIGKPGPKLGQKFRKRVGPSKSAMRAMNDETTEEF
jgi:hypothetical protein